MILDIGALAALTRFGCAGAIGLSSSACAPLTTVKVLKSARIY